MYSAKYIAIAIMIMSNLSAQLTEIKVIEVQHISNELVIISSKIIIVDNALIATVTYKIPPLEGGRMAGSDEYVIILARHVREHLIKSYRIKGIQFLKKEILYPINPFSYFTGARYRAQFLIELY